MANSLRTMLPTYWERRMGDRILIPIKRPNDELLRMIELPTPWAFKLARVCEVAIVALLIAGATLLYRTTG